MMEVHELARRFHRHLAYRQAQPWRKPLINPRRFFSNQLRKRGLVFSKPGEPRDVATFHLPRFTVVTGEGVSEEIAGYGIYEPNLTAALLRLIKPGDVAVDIGMHLGYYTVLLAMLVGDKGQVHAFEPTPSTRLLAERNIEGFPQVTLHSQAVWSRAQTLSFRDYGLQWMAFNSFTNARMENFHGDPKTIAVEATTLDLFRANLGRRIAFVKIDAESAEREIIAGATSLLGTDGPALSLEVGDFEGQIPSREVIQRLQAEGYSPWEFDGIRFRRHQPKSVYSYDNLVFVPEKADLCQL